MKRIAKSVFKILLVVVLFTGGSIALSTSGINTVSEARAATQSQVTEYLLANGYTIQSLGPKEATKFDWIAMTTKNGVHYSTTIYCTETSIIGNTDVAL
jgi:hypothetical protein